MFGFVTLQWTHSSWSPLGSEKPPFTFAALFAHLPAGCRSLWPGRRAALGLLSIRGGRGSAALCYLRLMEPSCSSWPQSVEVFMRRGREWWCDINQSERFYGSEEWLLLEVSCRQTSVTGCVKCGAGMLPGRAPTLRSVPPSHPQLQLSVPTRRCVSTERTREGWWLTSFFLSDSTTSWLTSWMLRHTDTGIRWRWRMMFCVRGGLPLLV